MLTKSDLSQIRKIVREEVENEVQSTRDELQAEIKLVRMELSTRIDRLEDKFKNTEIRIGNIETSTNSIDRRLKRIESNIKKMRKDISVTIEHFDREAVVLHRRVKKAEEHLGLTAS